MHHINHDWKRFYENDSISDRPIVELTTLELKNWARNKIISGKLSKKVYYNMTVIIRQSLEYLVELGELPANPFTNFKINRSLFTPVVEKESEYEVFSEVEEQQIKEYALQDFARNEELTTALAVVLNFSLGLRVGELVALKWKDLRNPICIFAAWSKSSMSSCRRASGTITLKSWNTPSLTPAIALFMWFPLP